MFSPKLVSSEIPGLYQDESGFWVRPPVDGKRTWRKLDALTLKTAVKEAERKLSQHANFLAGESTTSPFQDNAHTFERIAALYLAAGCPHSRTKTGRDDRFCNGERERIEWLNKFFGDKKPDDIKLPLLLKHAEWRKKHIHQRNYMGKPVSGARAIEMEWVTLSNVLSYAVFHGLATFNHIRQQRPQLRADNPGNTVATQIRHSREVSPASGDVVHQVARELFDDPRSQSTGWLWLFACLTGLRRSELLRLRLDAKPPAHPEGIGEPGYTDDRFLHVRRGKRSRLHRVLLFPELSELIHAHFRWHQEKHPSSPFYFPGQRGQSCLEQTVPCHRIPIVCARLGLPRMTMHGARAFFTTVLRSKGLGEAEIAARIGDSTVEIVQESYGSIPGNWEGGKALDWLPSTGEPAWTPWKAIKPALTPSDSPQTVKNAP